MTLLVTVALATAALGTFCGAAVVRAYMRSVLKLHRRVEITLFLFCGPYGWLLLQRFRASRRRRYLKNVSN
jgi:hypothetical protein